MRENRDELQTGAFGYAIAALCVVAATGVALPLEFLVGNQSLVLVYVLAVVATGLGRGSRPAVLSAVLSFLSYNFFFTEPRYTLEVMHREELASLVFLFLIALLCGPAASRIRRQFQMLHEANRYSEAMRLLGQGLSTAEDARAVWSVAASELGGVLGAQCCIVHHGEEGLQSHPEPSIPFTPLDKAAAEWALERGVRTGRFSDTLGDSPWCFYPVQKTESTIAVAACRFDSFKQMPPPAEIELIGAMLREAADTWRRVKLAGDLESARVKSEVEQLRSALLSSVSHDLKSPLSVMMGAAESLKVLDVQLTPSDRLELIDTIEVESRRLETYIQNLLDMTRLGHGTLKIERDWVSIADIVGSAITRLKRSVPGVRTEFHAPEQPPVLYVHAALVEQALFNILENAAKFSPPDEKVEIRVRQENDLCELQVNDCGPGIPELLRERIFDMFYVVSDGDKKRRSTGMGLAICRGMIDAHGGSVTALPGPGGKGTCMIVELPVERPPAHRLRKYGLEEEKR